MKKVYLSGPIEGCTDYEMRNWREQVKLAIGEQHVIDPARRDFRHQELNQEQCENIVALDLKDLQDSDILVANCWKRGYGTIMEIAYAKMWGKSIIIVLPDEQPSVFVRTHADFYTSSLYEALGRLQQWI